MADLVIDPDDVNIASTSAVLRHGISGEAFDRATPIYRDGTGKWFRCQANGTVEQASILALSFSKSDAANDPFVYLLLGDLEVGPVLTQGELYVVSAAAIGKIAPYSDLFAGHQVSLVGIGKTTSVLGFNAVAFGVTI